MKSTANVSLTSWKETPYHEESETHKLTEVLAHFHYEGDLEAEGELRYLMAYTDDGPVTFVGLERVVGMLNGLFGTFVLQHIGKYESGEATMHLTVVPASGTGQLTGLYGSAQAGAKHNGIWPLELDWALPSDI
jgi:hypothetical protein